MRGVALLRIKISEVEIPDLVTILRVVPATWLCSIYTV